MTREELIDLQERNIRQALADYGRHTYDHTVLDDISDVFIERLAKDSTDSKQKLRELFRKSPTWDEDLQAIVINGNRTHDPDADTIRKEIIDLLFYTGKISGAVSRCLSDRGAWLYIPETLFTVGWDGTSYKADTTLARLVRAFYYFPLLFEKEECYKMDSAEAHFEDEYIEAINTLAPGAYAPNKKPSRILKALCKAVGIADETAGSYFQKQFAKISDEMNSRKISFKLYLSINPAHFLTMSNPKYDERGTMLTSCHSLNCDDYTYNSGCVGYARDETSFIVFTCADPNDRETLNNRKTSRQVFAYRPGSGLLMQSRMYTTSGGTYGKAEDTTLYRDLVQREISMLEDGVNSWITRDLPGNCSDYVIKGEDFGGYADWEYRDFDCHISFRKDLVRPGEDMLQVSPLMVGAPALCVECGEEVAENEGLYCQDHNKNTVTCEYCGQIIGSDEHYDALNSYGDTIYICSDCYSDHAVYCQGCDSPVLDDAIEIVDGMVLCPNCYEDRTAECLVSGERHLCENMYYVYDADGFGGYVYEDYVNPDDYFVCPDCGRYISKDYSKSYCPLCHTTINNEPEERTA